MHSKEQLVDQAVANYRAAASSIDSMFQVMSQRTTEEKWKKPGLFEGAGSCKAVPSTTSELGLQQSLAFSKLQALREARNNEVPVEDPKLAKCKFHRADGGCVLAQKGEFQGGLKGPMCLMFIDNPEELQDRFGINSPLLERDIKYALDGIAGSLNPFGFETRRLVVETMAYAQEITDHVEKFPVIEQKDQPASVSV